MRKLRFNIYFSTLVALLLASPRISSAAHDLVHDPISRLSKMEHPSQGRPCPQIECIGGKNDAKYLHMYVLYLYAHACEQGRLSDLVGQSGPTPGTIRDIDEMLNESPK